MRTTAKPLYKGRNQIIFDWDKSATQYWLENQTGNSYYLEQFGMYAWVVRCQQSYLTKNGNFVFKGDILSFEHSYFDETCEKWNHLFKSRDEALDDWILSEAYPYSDEKYNEIIEKYGKQAFDN